jgi:maltose/moltooligosaccharide transporter
MQHKPTLSFWQIWNMCFGFLGIQFGFALQNANMSRIFQTLGADMDKIPLLWIAAPLTGLLVQPIVGYFSDRTWTRLGRRRPYFLFGAIAASVALIFMPHSDELWIAAGMLWVLDASINVSMEPFRAFVGDQLPPSQHTKGYAMQSFFIGIGAVIASCLPWLFQNYFGVDNTAPEGQIPDTVRYAFYWGAAVLLVAVGWTVFSTREYPPEQLNAFEQAIPEQQDLLASPSPVIALPWLVLGGGLAYGVAHFSLEKELYLLAGGLVAFGAALYLLSVWRVRNAFTQIMSDMYKMPDTMKRLAVVQFFSWFALFAMWIYTTPAVTSVHFAASDPTSEAYNTGANWVSVLFGAYNGFAALAAIVIPIVARRLGMRLTHLFNLCLGAAALLSIYLIQDADWLMLSMVGIGFAWASILSLPYALLCDCLPVRKLGVYMGIFNFFIVLPQLVAATILGLLVKHLFEGKPIYALVLGALSFFIAGLCTLRVREPSFGTQTRALGASA